jgi:hypothetical protein
MVLTEMFALSTMNAISTDRRTDVVRHDVCAQLDEHNEQQLSAYTCSLQVNKGITCGSGSSYRYFFNSQLKECQSFFFAGCDGNSNNFPSAEKCEEYCGIGGKRTSFFG